jgi:hypothetical protein
VARHWRSDRVWPRARRLEIEIRDGPRARPSGVEQAKDCWPHPCQCQTALHALTLVPISAPPFAPTTNSHPSYYDSMTYRSAPTSQPPAPTKTLNHDKKTIPHMTAFDGCNSHDHPGSWCTDRRPVTTPLIPGRRPLCTSHAEDPTEAGVLVERLGRFVPRSARPAADAVAN